jgi:single-strand DNA-binding protein
MLNKVTLIGRLGAEPETRVTPTGATITNLRLATTERWKDPQGQKQERTEWHRIILFGRLAEVAPRYLHKGSLIYVEGRIQTRKWQDKTGADRYTTEIVAQEMTMLDPKPATASSPSPPGGEGPGERGNPAPPTAFPGADDFDDSDIPF